MVPDPRTGLILVLSTIFILGPIPESNALTREDLYPYNGIGSSILEINPDGHLETAEIRLRTPISYYDIIYDTIYVNGNGALSVLAPMPRFLNVPFPLDYPVIAPLYTHVDTRGSGAVYWAETDAQAVISKAANTIHQVFTNSEDFYPTHVLLATWDNVGYFNAKNDKVNTYQVAISSNGSHSYVEFLYPEEGIQWIQADFHPGGLPDAKAQAGLVSREGRITTLKGSGTDQIQNIDKWSNTGNPGQWLFRIGPIAESQDLQQPDNIEDAPANNEIPSCLTGATSCHSKAECVDYSSGFCCVCKTGFFGNGRSCQQNELPLRLIGKVSGNINGEEFDSKDLQCYVQTKDGRTYTAMSRVPDSVASKSQLLVNLGGIIGWLFAKPIEKTKNGYQITGGVFNLTAEIIFTNTSDKITIRSRYMGLDVFGQLKMETDIRGTLPSLASDARVEYGDHEELYTKTQPGTIVSQSSRSYRIVGESSKGYPFTQSIVIDYKRCEFAPDDGDHDTVRLKFSRGLTSYEDKEHIIRFAMNTKIAPLELEDPCIQGRSQCGDHSSCFVEGDDFKCVCNPGYQYLYEEDGSAHCVDVNECTSGTHACSQDALCINNEGSHVCQCLEGFVGDGRVCDKLQTCDDVDCGVSATCILFEGKPACSQNWTPEPPAPCAGRVCSPYSRCVEDPDQGTSQCQCVTGFTGNGYECVPESSVNTPTEPTPTREPLRCPEGFENQDDRCVQSYTDESTTAFGDNWSGPSSTEPDDIEDFQQRPLPVCLDDRCSCIYGYDYDRRRGICVSLPGYLIDTKGPARARLSCNVRSICHPYAQCIYQAGEGEGFYVCQCNEGYEGDGFECRKTEVSCLEADICDPNAACRPAEPTGVKCLCNPGYEGDGFTCFPIDECSVHTDCGDNEQCQYNRVTSRYTCDCSPGYNRVDDVCIIADCLINPAQCHPNAHCVALTDGSYTCACLEGYNGDGFHECISDHVGCNIINNCGPNAVCGYNYATSNYACQCNAGYYGDGFTCRQEFSCKRDPALCSVDATCIAAGENQFACVCNAGFTGNGADCIPIPQHDSNILLMNQGMAMLRMPFFPTPDNPGAPISIVFKQMSVALDIDCAGGRAYWSDVAGHRISSVTYNGSDPKVFVDDVNSPEGVAIDWVARNVFWTDSTKGTIEVANLETKKTKILISEGLVNPRGIAAHPYRGKIFWSDWNRESPKLEWANEDGTQRGIFLQNEHVQLPNSLAIDWSTDELCWADAGSHAINCANIDTRAVRVVAENLSYPFGLAISQDHYYWTDWTSNNKVQIGTKNSGERNKPLEVPPGGSDKLFGIVAVPDFCPRVSNVCQYDNGRCNVDQLCLPDGHGGRTCACADNASGSCADEYQSA